VAKLI